MDRVRRLCIICPKQRVSLDLMESVTSIALTSRAMVTPASVIASHPGELSRLFSRISGGVYSIKAQHGTRGRKGIDA